MPKKNKQVYMGPNSTAGIFTQGKVDTDWEVLMNLYGTAYDSLDGQMLTQNPKRLDKATINEVKGRFLVIKNIAKKHAPQKLETIRKIESITISNIKGNLSDKVALDRIKIIIHQNSRTPNQMLQNVEHKINIAQGMSQRQNDFNNPFSNLMQQQKPKSNGKKRTPTPLFAISNKEKKTLGDLFLNPSKSKQRMVPLFDPKQMQMKPLPLFQQPKKRKTVKRRKK